MRPSYQEAGRSESLARLVLTRRILQGRSRIAQARRRQEWPTWRRRRRRARQST